MYQSLEAWDGDRGESKREEKERGTVMELISSNEADVGRQLEYSLCFVL